MKTLVDHRLIHLTGGELHIFVCVCTHDMQVSQMDHQRHIFYKGSRYWVELYPNGSMKLWFYPDCKYNRDISVGYTGPSWVWLSENKYFMMLEEWREDQIDKIFL